MNEVNICKSKDCNNPALDGKYCDYCTQVRKERKSTAAKVAVGVAAGAVGAARAVGAVIKSGTWKKVPELAIKVVRVIFKK